jgi:carbamoyl-phosphate synthase small subunit
MKFISDKEACLLLEDGTFYKGISVGKLGTTTGEICFSTGMTGYQEIYTDPSYLGQIIVNTSTHIGNYGVMAEEQESSSVKFSGLVCSNFSEEFSRKSADGSLQSYFEQHNVVGISGIDTRALVRHIRNKGGMNAIISSEILDKEELVKILEKVPSMKGLELSSKVYTKNSYFVGAEDSKYRVAVLDLGIKDSMLRNLTERNVYCKVFPGNTSFEEMETWNPDGYFISNGPGDPSATGYAIETVKKILDKETPMFGICLGHQIIAEANDIPTFKMHHGHRGLNHPVKNLMTGRSEITSQNHGFSVSKEHVDKSDKVDISHINLNDGSVEGIKTKNGKVFSVQYHPESRPGPHDSFYLFDDFISLLKK